MVISIASFRGISVLTRRNICSAVVGRRNVTWKKKWSTSNAKPLRKAVVGCRIVERVVSLRLPAAVANGVVVTTCPATTTTAATTTATATSPAATATAATAVAAHLVQTRINLLLGLRKNLDKITGLLGVCKRC